MSLSENIREHRTKRGLSQGDLADALGVSRQSVSKWETGESVPDLEKIIKMSELFSISLDELVKGEKPRGASEIRIIEAPRREFPTRIIVGTILLCAAVITFMIFVVLAGRSFGLLCLPFLICGLICLLTKKHTALICGWTAFFIAMLFLPRLFAFKIWYIFIPHYYMGKRFWGWYLGLAVAWALLISLCLLIYHTWKAIKNRNAA